MDGDTFTQVPPEVRTTRHRRSATETGTESTPQPRRPLQPLDIRPAASPLRVAEPSLVMPRLDLPELRAPPVAEQERRDIRSLRERYQLQLARSHSHTHPATGVDTPNNSRFNNSDSLDYPHQGLPPLHPAREMRRAVTNDGDLATSVDTPIGGLSNNRNPLSRQILPLRRPQSREIRFTPALPNPLQAGIGRSPSSYTTFGPEIPPPAGPAPFGIPPPTRYTHTSEVPRLVGPGLPDLALASRQQAAERAARPIAGPRRKRCRQTGEFAGQGADPTQPPANTEQEQVDADWLEEDDEEWEEALRSDAWEEVSWEEAHRSDA